MRYLYRDVKSIAWMQRHGGCNVRMRLAEALWSFAARHLPKQLTYHAAIQLGVNATTGRYGNQIVPDLTFTDALKRWEAAP